MGKIIIQDTTIKNPITIMGKQAGICYGADISNDEKNFKRGLDCLKNNHGRVSEFPDVYMVLEGYSARVIREWYTHIGGMPTRLQASTRYIDYEHGFNYVIPHSVKNNTKAEEMYNAVMNNIMVGLKSLFDLGIPKEDCAMLLPLGMETTITCKHNLRNLMDMSRQRMCTRAYWEYRELFKDICEALKEYSEEWKYLIDNYFYPKCEALGYCPENKSCGRKDKNIFKDKNLKIPFFDFF